jgi:hypothetical protein
MFPITMTYLHRDSVTSIMQIHKKGIILNDLILSPFLEIEYQTAI